MVNNILTSENKMTSEDEQYMIEEAQSLRKTDIYAAKAMLLTAKTLFPNSFKVHYDAYQLEVLNRNFVEAAKCFSTIATNFPHQHAEMWQEVMNMTSALRENESLPDHEFYLNMYDNLTPDVQHNVLMHTINNTASNAEQCKLLLLMFNKFPKSSTAQVPRLLELITEGMKTDADLYQRMLVEEVLPLIQFKPPELSPVLACRLYTSSLEYYLRQIMDDEICDIAEAWKNIFKVLMLCGQMMGWEPFVPFNPHPGRQNVYWEKLVDILSVSNGPGGSSQVLFYATTLFIYSLHGYISSCKVRIEDTDISHVLVEGFMDWTPDGAEVQSMEPPKFSLTTSISQELSKAFLHAAQCWQLLNTDQFQRDFSQLMLALPLAPWISRFLFDLAIYFGHRDEANKLMNDMTAQNTLVQSLQILSLNLMQGNMTLQGFQCILKIVAELPNTAGQLLENITLNGHRHMIFLPLTRNALIQYCTRAIVTTLSRKLYEPNCSDRLLGDLLVLLQLNLNQDMLLRQRCFQLIRQHKSFNLRTLSTYIVSAEMIEELAHIWNTQQDDANFELTGSPTGGLAATVAAAPTTRRIGTRGADRGARDEFRGLIRQQIARANENVPTLVMNFISQEHLTLAQHIFGVPPPVETIIIK